MIQIKREVIDKEILTHFNKHFNPESPQLDFELRFNHTTDGNTFQLIVTYSNCNINIYDFEDVTCSCCDFDVMIEIIDSENTLIRDLVLLEDELVEQYETDCYESRNNPPLNICNNYKEYM